MSGYHCSEEGACKSSVVHERGTRGRGKVLGRGRLQQQSGAVIGCPSDARNCGRKPVFISGTKEEGGHSAGSVRDAALSRSGPAQRNHSTSIRQTSRLPWVGAMWPFGFTSPWQRLYYTYRVLYQHQDSTVTKSLRQIWYKYAVASQTRPHLRSFPPNPRPLVLYHTRSIREEFTKLPRTRKTNPIKPRFSDQSIMRVTSALGFVLFAFAATTFAQENIEIVKERDVECERKTAVWRPLVLLPCS